MEKSKPQTGRRMTIFESMIRLKCPQCHEENLFIDGNPYKFKTIEKMHKTCPNCGRDFVIEPGFYFGAAYVSYGLNIAWIVPTFLLMYFVLELPYRTFVVTMFILLIVLGPVIFRLSRSIWLHAFVKRKS